MNQSSGLVLSRLPHVTEDSIR